MCCFSGPVDDVAATRIFARACAANRHMLAYEMRFAAKEPVAMILPIPVPPHSDETAVRFISLEAYPQFFTDLFQAFHPPSGAFGPPSNVRAAPPPLVVHEVGAFVASFVPSLADFDRLDPRFRIPAGTIDRVDEYADWGFVVFQLAATRGAVQVHPMAFEFPTRSPDRLFFPLVHVHDGVLHAEAEMDHTLYAQGVDSLRTFSTLHLRIGQYFDTGKAAGLLDPERRLSMQALTGTHPNRDLWVTLLDRR